MAAPETPEELLSALNKGIDDSVFIFDCAQKGFGRLLELRQTLSELDGTQQVFETLLSLRVEFDRIQTLVNTLLQELISRRNGSFRHVESKTRGKPPITPPGRGGNPPGQGR